MYLPLASKGLKTYPGLPGTALAVGNMGSVEEGVSGDGEELGFTCERLFVVLDAPPRLLIAAAAADFLSGAKRTETGFGYRELYAPLTASTPAPIGPPAAMAVPPVADTLLSTFTVWGTYPALLTVTVKLSRRLFTNCVGVTPFSPEESTTFAPDGSLNTVSLSWEPRVMVAQDVIRTTGRHSKTLLVNRSIVVEFGKTYRILVVFQSAGKFSCSGIPPRHFRRRVRIKSAMEPKSPLLATACLCVSITLPAAS
jgi:hypothetical protein